MLLIQRVFRLYRWPLALVVLLSISSGLLSVGVIAFVNERMINSADMAGGAIWQFCVLLALMLAFASGAQICLTTLGHRFVYGLRREMVKRLLDTDVQTVERLGHGRLFASLSSDIRNVTLAFVHLPELIYGGVLTLASFAYLAWLSSAMFVATAVWMVFTLALGWRLLLRLRRHLALLREAEDGLYRQYQEILDGTKELALNRDRARHIYDGDFDASARSYRDHITLADRYHGLASNWANIMVLGTIGLAFYLAKGLGWADPAVAATYAMTILFMRTPLVSAVAAVPAQLAGNVALSKVESLGLAQARPGFDMPGRSGVASWRTLELRDVSYRYPAEDDDPGFDVGPLNVTLRRGETVFVIGGNGSGKSSLARLLSGIYTSQSGGIFLDGRGLTAADRPGYRRLFSAVFTDFHLFSQLIGPDGREAAAAPLHRWLDALQMREKARIADGRLLNTKVSQGQRKRLALLLSLLEERDILLLDEWAADQDPLYRRVFYRELLPALKESGITVVVISHDDRYFDMADRLLKMEGGQLTDLVDSQRARAGRDALGEIDGTQHPT
ncbi:multidrug ABC transporter permease/ATP-binding protein [Pollutimonas bauzanensis]|uniref:Putative ATP-binding cassette transporter n=1 Tax=Pollutimonas bauzanensis TaxID=658167 RepID=A0A1M5S8G3_9BURK|nr:multidrug ABC transporter permease/ATP-binding protein [Pollutimonas bauzanensis]SHH34771.1 putative ATP-binding cassette transporter [Pollutimonas bauzanensis]